MVYHTSAKTANRREIKKGRGAIEGAPPVGELLGGGGIVQLIWTELMKEAKE